jgi:hypothetical protein
MIPSLKHPNLQIRSDLQLGSPDKVLKDKKTAAVGPVNPVFWDHGGPMPLAANLVDMFSDDAWAL